MSLFKIVDTDNFGGDYPDESFLGYIDSEGKATAFVYTRKPDAQAIVDTLNGPNAEHNRRYWMVKPADYQLKPGFEP